MPRRRPFFVLGLTLVSLTFSAAWAQNTTITVQPGDTLWGLAQRYSTTVDALRQANSLVGDALKPGTSLKLPQGGNATPDAYVVQPGDTLYDIALAFHLRVDDLIAYNNLERLHHQTRADAQAAAEHARAGTTGHHGPARRYALEPRSELPGDGRDAGQRQRPELRRHPPPGRQPQGSRPLRRSQHGHRRPRAADGDRQQGRQPVVDRAPLQHHGRGAHERQRSALQQPVRRADAAHRAGRRARGRPLQLRHPDARARLGHGVADPRAHHLALRLPPASR